MIYCEIDKCTPELDLVIRMFFLGLFAYDCLLIYESDSWFIQYNNTIARTALYLVGTHSTTATSSNVPTFLNVMLVNKFDLLPRYLLVRNDFFSNNLDPNLHSYRSSSFR